MNVKNNLLFYEQNGFIQFDDFLDECYKHISSKFIGICIYMSTLLKNHSTISALK